ncbi:MAG: restriction endonuclease, partial [Chloroflexota bacterium]|nr:restriction endonuclease [Chloroflexota bacterium]
YEAALTVMMRLVFLLSAEERGMLLLGTPLYDQYYAVSTMHKQLRELADQHGEEVLGLRFDAWSRLLATFRIVFGGVEYLDLRLPAYGGRLFDPDRFPFLEGRAPGSSWLDTLAQPLAIDNRTVLHLLNALQYLHTKVPGGGSEPRRLSFRGLDIEQIGHVYEGLLDHTAKRATTTILGLAGTGDMEPEVALEELEAYTRRGEPQALDFLHEVTGRSVAALQKQVAARLEKPQERSRLMEACENRAEIFARVLPFAGLLRKDTFGTYLIVTPGSVYVTSGSDRRSTGTHYTPRSLTEPMVQHTLDPLVYLGPAEGLPMEEWRLRPAGEILDLKVCDFAMGSGAFLVQACRYLAEKLVEAWENAEKALNGTAGGAAGARKPQITPDGQLSRGRPEEELLPIDTEERLALARRLVSERCLYGVDKNPMAVEMAKLSLWLITLARNRPFTFLDHALRCGDSLLGVNERQLANWSLDARPGEVTQMLWIRGVMERALATALKLRRKISRLPDRDVHDIEAKERLLKEADAAMTVVKLGADLLIAITLSEPKRRPALQDTLGLDYSLLAKAYEEGIHGGPTEQGWEPRKEEFKRLRAEVDALLRGRKPFHWFLEFPEVFTGKSDDEAGFAAIVSNPPFQGGQKITGAIGTDYRDYLVSYLANGKRGSADLCAYFFLQATRLVQYEGMCALLATNTIAQGDTREVGLDQIVASEWTIPRAVPSRKWPGEASLEVAYIWLRHGIWQGFYVLDEMNVVNITTSLTIPGKAQGKPYTLYANTGKSFIGSFVLGMGFILTPEEAQALIKKDVRNRNVVFPILNGDDLNTRYDQSPSRWAVNFHDWPLEKAKEYHDCIEILRERVKPEREAHSEKTVRERWWLYKRPTVTLYNTVAPLKRVLAIPFVSKYITCSWIPTGIVYWHPLVIIASESNANYAALQSSLHDSWARFHGSTLETRMRYTPSDCFETFPFPSSMSTLDDIGERYYTHRQSIMLTRQEGLTKTYNRFHDPRESSSDIVTLRELHREMDEAVARAYGWDDLRLEHGFHETKQGLRYTISEEARREVLDRLLLLNHQRREEEVRAGLFEPKKKAGGKGKGKGPTRKAAERPDIENNGDVGHTMRVQEIRERAGEYDSIEAMEEGLEQGSLFDEL